METPHKFVTAKLSIRKLRSSSGLLVHCKMIARTDEDQSLWIESFAIMNLHGVFTRLN